MANKDFQPGIEQARALDQQDVLGKYRSRFFPLTDNKVYMDGNSLGLASIDAEKALLKVMDVWKK
ncbi:MAG: kynureninase, partial [Flavobacterium sp.]